MGQGPETRLVAKIRRALMNEHPSAKLYKIHGSQYQEAGIPDIIGCVDGRFVGIEVKTPTGRVSKAQELQLRKLKAAGGIVGVARSVEEAMELVATKQ